MAAVRAQRPLLSSCRAQSVICPSPLPRPPCPTSLRATATTARLSTSRRKSTQLRLSRSRSLLCLRCLGRLASLLMRLNLLPPLAASLRLRSTAAARIMARLASVLGLELSLQRVRRDTVHLFLRVVRLVSRLVVCLRWLVLLLRWCCKHVGSYDILCRASHECDVVIY